MEFVLLRTRVQVAALSRAAWALIEEVVASPDATYTPEYFLSRIHSGALPRVVTCHDGGVLVGIVYIYELPIAGVPTGYAFGGDQMGRGLIVCAVQHEPEMLTAACSFLMQNGLHAMRLDWTPRQPLEEEAALKMPLPGESLKIVADPRTEGDWLNLLPDYDQFLAQLGSHTRRNLRYYRRKVEAAGLKYSGTLAPSEFREAMRSLNRLADYPMEREELARDKRFMATFGTPVVAGLCSEDGNFVSLVTGYTVGKHLHILTQLNGEDETLRKLSISVVLRGYLIEDFIGRGFTAVHFFQGSSPMLGRFCAPVDLHHVSIDRENWLMTPFKRMASAMAEARQRKSERVPYRLQWAAGSYWAQPRHEAKPLAAVEEDAVSNSAP